MKRHAFAFSVAALLASAPAGDSVAGPVSGKLELPTAPERPASGVKGFIDRVENPRKPVQALAVGPQLLVVLEGAAKPEGAAQVFWDLVGESFARPVVGVPVGFELVIKNTSKTARTLTALEDAALVPGGPLNPTGSKSFRVTEPKVYTITDKDAPHLKGRVVGVATPYIAYVEVTGSTGKFELADVPEGSYKLRVFFQDHWLDLEQAVTVPAKGKTEITAKIPAGFPPKK